MLRLETIVKESLKRLDNVDVKLESLLRDELANALMNHESFRSKTEDGLEDLKQRVDRLKLQSEVGARTLLGICLGIREGQHRLEQLSVLGVRGTRESLESIQRQQNRLKLPLDLAQLQQCMQSPLSPFRALRVLLERVLGHLETCQRVILQGFQQLITADLRTHEHLTRLESNQLALPSMLSGIIQEDIYFEDVLGRTEKLQYSTFRYWSVFYSWLVESFSGKPGRRKVIENQYFIMHTDHSYGIIRGREQWNQKVLPGMRLCMSIVMHWLHHGSGECLKPECTGQIAPLRNESAHQW
jgi:hypothetical protein